jgi:hypothetical protein
MIDDHRRGPVDATLLDHLRDRCGLRPAEGAPHPRDRTW